jgi:hypothetical protein
MQGINKNRPFLTSTVIWAGTVYHLLAYGLLITWRFIIAFTKALHWSLPWALYLGLLSGLFPICFPFLLHVCYMPWISHPPCLDMVKSTSYQIPHYVVFSNIMSLTRQETFWISTLMVSSSKQFICFNINVGFNITDQLLIRSSAFTRYCRKNGSTMRQYISYS